MNAVTQWSGSRSEVPIGRAPNALAMETMGRLVSGVAHDFNNLLTGIMLYCDLLIAGLEGNPQLQNQVRKCALPANKVER